MSEQKAMPTGRIAKKQNQMKLNRLGKIRVGEKRKIQKGNREIEIPSSLDYFTATGKYAEKFFQAYPEKPTTIGIVFVSDNILDVCNERYELRDQGGKLIAFGDGTHFKIWNGTDYQDFIVGDDDDRSQMSDLAKQWSSGKYKAKWQCLLTLQFVIPKVNDVFGVWVFETKGQHSSIPNIRDTFDMVQDMAGTVVNVPFDLTVEKVKSQRPGDTQVYPVVTLIPNISKDKMEDISNFLEQGRTINDVKKLLETPQPEDVKQIEEKKVEQLKTETKKKVQERGAVSIQSSMFD